MARQKLLSIGAMVLVATACSSQPTKEQGSQVAEMAPIGVPPESAQQANVDKIEAQSLVGSAALANTAGDTSVEASNVEAQAYTTSSDVRPTAKDDYIPTGDLVQSYTCTHATDKRLIQVMNNTESGAACEVSYQKSTGTKVLWSARNDQSYCLDRAAEFALKQAGWGWHCQDQDGVAVILKSKVEEAVVHNDMSTDAKQATSSIENDATSSETYAEESLVSESSQSPAAETSVESLDQSSGENAAESSLESAVVESSDTETAAETTDGANTAGL